MSVQCIMETCLKTFLTFYDFIILDGVIGAQS